MNHKKIVKFHISNKELYTGEFHENTKLRMLKAYFKDISHFPKFKFIFNGETLEEEEKTIREILRGSHGTELFLKVSLQSGGTSSSTSSLINDKVYLSQSNISYNANSETTKKHSSSNLSAVIPQQNNSLTNLRIQNTNENLIKENYNLKLKTNELESQVLNLQDENVNLVKIIKEMNDNLLMLQKAYDNSNSQNFSLNKKIDQMRVEYSELESAFSQLKEKYEKYAQSPKNRKSNALAEGKRKSLEKHDANFQNYQAKRMSRENDLHLTQHTHGNIPTGGNITNTQENKNENKKSTLKKSGFAQAASHTSSSVPERKSFNKDVEAIPVIVRKGSLNPQNGANQIVSEFIIKNENVSESNKLTSIENLRIINCEVSKNFRAIKSDYKSKWVEILKYLNPKDQMTLSLSNKEMLKTVGCYWYDLSYAKIENINKILVVNIRDYELILKEHNFILSASTNTALRMLDHSKYTDVFSNDNSYFNNINLLPVYRLLFQFSKVCDGNLQMDTDQFINKFKIYFKENSKKLSQVLKALPNICDFSDINIEKIKQITDFYNMSTIDCAMLGKICKTTGILGFFVKDALAYCGLESTLERKIRFEPRDKERINIIRDNIEIKEMRNKYKKIQETLEQIMKQMSV